MNSNYVATLTSSSFLLVCTIVFEWYEFPRSSSFAAMKSSIGPNFPTMVAKFNGQIPQTLKPKFDVLFFQTLLQNFVYSFYQGDFVWFQKVMFFHGNISFLY